MSMMREINRKSDRKDGGEEKSEEKQKKNILLYKMIVEDRVS